MSHVWRHSNTFHCNTLQHTATHCNTLQHTTPSYNLHWTLPIVMPSGIPGSSRINNDTPRERDTHERDTYIFHEYIQWHTERKKKRERETQKHICIYTYIFIYIYINIYTRFSWAQTTTHSWAQTMCTARERKRKTYVNKCMYTNIHEYIHIYICIYIYTYIYTYVCILICIYICTCI